MDGVLFGCFKDESWARRRVPATPGTQLLLIEREPTVVASSMGQFKFQGFDLIEDLTRISALTNCGGFPLAFSGSELNQLGLLPTLKEAKRVQAKLREQYPHENHADTSAYAMYR